MKILPICLAIVTVLPTVSAGNLDITYERLLHEMVDLAALAEYPDPPYLAARASSNDPTPPEDTVPAGFENCDHGYYRDTLPEGYPYAGRSGTGSYHPPLERPFEQYNRFLF